MRFGKGTVLATAVVLGALARCSVWGQESASKPIAGLISELSGGASIRPTDGAGGGRAQRFDTIAVGAILEIGPQSRAVIVLSGGQRFELGPNARATIAEKHLTSTSGPIAELPPLPPLPRLVALDESRPKGPPGSVRLRDTAISGLRPSHGVTLAERTVLRFTPVRGASRYGAEIANEAGTRVFAAESTTPEVIVPAGVLEPEARYYWTVQTLDKLGAVARGASEFRTLSVQDARVRQALRRSLEAEGDGGALALVAEVDRRLGLHQEALDGFRAALAGRPDDLVLQQIIRRLENLPERIDPQ
jgi:hypothetical protein